MNAIVSVLAEMIHGGEEGVVEREGVPKDTRERRVGRHALHLAIDDITIGQGSDGTEDLVMGAPLVY